jgi:hypothetical protein
MSRIGIVWPTKVQLARADRHADKMKAAALADAEKELVGLEKRTVGGEVRYYKTETIYTPALKRGGVRRWFETRPDGDYAIQG